MSAPKTWKILERAAYGTVDPLVQDAANALFEAALEFAEVDAADAHAVCEAKRQLLRAAVDAYQEAKIARDGRASVRNAARRGRAPAQSESAGREPKP